MNGHPRRRQLRLRLWLCQVNHEFGDGQGHFTRSFAWRDASCRVEPLLTREHFTSRRLDGPSRCEPSFGFAHPAVGLPRTTSLPAVCCQAWCSRTLSRRTITQVNWAWLSLTTLLRRQPNVFLGARQYCAGIQGTPNCLGVYKISIDGIFTASAGGLVIFLYTIDDVVLAVRVDSRCMDVVSYHELEATEDDGSCLMFDECGGGGAVLLRTLRL